MRHVIIGHPPQADPYKEFRRRPTPNPTSRARGAERRGAERREERAAARTSSEAVEQEEVAEGHPSPASPAADSEEHVSACEVDEAGSAPREAEVDAPRLNRLVEVCLAATDGWTVSANPQPISQPISQPSVEGEVRGVVRGFRYGWWWVV